MTDILRETQWLTDIHRERDVVDRHAKREGLTNIQREREIGVTDMQREKLTVMLRESGQMAFRMTKTDRHAERDIVVDKHAERK